MVVCILRSDIDLFDYTFAQNFWIQTLPTTQFSFVVMP